MPEHEIHWTALPRRASGEQLELDVFVSPRLGTDGLAVRYKLAEFPELANWTARVKAPGALAFGVSFDGGPPVAATIMPPDAYDEELWDHLFPPGTPVRPWSFRDLGSRPLRSFPVRWVLAYLRDVYREVGREPGWRLPRPADLDRVRDPLGQIPDSRVPEEYDNTEPHPRPGGGEQPQGCLTAILAPLCRLLRPLRRWRWVRRLCRWLAPLCGTGEPRESVEYRHRPVPPRPDDPYAEIEDLMEAHGAVPPFEARDPNLEAELGRYPVHRAFAETMRFYDRREADPGAEGPAPEPEWDFHRRLGALADYPELMRRLGLTIRLRVPRPPGAPAKVAVVPRLGGSERPGIDIAPATACMLDGDRFHAQPRAGSDLAAGMLDLSGADDRLRSTSRRFDLVQVDADGAAIKAVIAGASLERREQLRREGLGYLDPEAEPEPLPATRSGGIAIVREGRAWGLKGRLERVRAHHQSSGGEPLFADEVVRGYEVWVKREDEGWLSLCRRRGLYRLVDDANALVGTREVEDHGYVKRSGATSAEPDSDLYLHEAIVRWTGWSLAAPLPGQVMTGAEEREAMVSKAGTGLRLETRFVAAAGSMPRLRFGQEYRFAMVWVDLAGRPLTQLEGGPTDADRDRVSAPIAYHRFEPLPPPSLLPFGAYAPGGSLERLVVRSDFDLGPDQWLAKVAPGLLFAAADQRRVFPPKTSQLMAELHGCFDQLIDAGRVAEAFELAAREKGTFEDPAPAVLPFGETQKLVEAGAETVVNKHPDQVLVAPYLPDPLARGLLLRDVPGLTLAGGVSGDPLEVAKVPGKEGAMLRVPFSGEWPDRESLRLRAAGDDPGAAPHWDKAKRVLTIQLEKAAVATVPYSCYYEPDKLDLLGIWDWIDDGVQGELEALARQSVHWMLAPWRELVLVHAVQRPLREPFLGPDAFAERRPGETGAIVSGTASADPASAGQVDLEALWEDWRDDLPKTTGLVKEPHAATVGHWQAGTPMPPQRQEFGDTRHRLVRYRLCASSRFREYMPEGIEQDTKRQGPERLVSVPATVAPDPPRIAYAVPAFGWRQEEGPAGDAVLGVGERLRRTRLGGGLRVFLGRPWYSSGEGERLAVVVPGPDEPATTPVSRIGIDPTVGESAWPRTRELEAAMFAGAECWEAVELSERPARVGIASYVPKFDPQRQLWACDVSLEMATLPWEEWPFIRLALARHQPDAVRGARLSKVELAQWAQLAPDRRLVVERTGADEVKVVLRGRGRLAPQANRMVVAAEVAPSGAPDELEWAPAAGGAAPQLGLDLWAAGHKHRRESESEELIWEAEVEVPPVAGALRLSVRELEQREGEGEGEGEVATGVHRFTYADAVRLA